jgi:hypothetical protein
MEIEGRPITPKLKFLNALHCVYACELCLLFNGPSARKSVMVLDRGDLQVVACMSLY